MCYSKHISSVSTTKFRPEMGGFPTNSSFPDRMILCGFCELGLASLSGNRTVMGVWNYQDVLVIGTSERTNPERKTQFGSGQKPDPPVYPLRYICSLLSSQNFKGGVCFYLDACRDRTPGWPCMCVYAGRQCDRHTCREI